MRELPAIAELRKSLYSAVVCDALDAVGLKNQSPRVPLLPITGEQVLLGRCKTTLWVDMYHEVPNPYELELRAVDEARPDDVLIAAASGSRRSAVWGELLSTASRNRGCVGAVVDGLVRDVRRMKQMQFPVFARGTSPYDSQNRQRVVDIDVPVEIGGVRFHPGDLVIADADGVVVVPREVEREVIGRAWDKVHTENRIREAIRGGMGAQEAYDRFGVL
ncbi:MAG: RraA family protein [Planctomycetota bacterium]|nr:MAG: RraA family protein [Planctomycetota bacterium]